MDRIIKTYKEWMGIKSDINNNGLFRKINEGDVVWVAVGENVGVEIDGKSAKYSRPVIVLKKHNSICFTGIPLTSRKHVGSWYYTFSLQGKMQTAVLIQSRLFDTTRVYNRMGKLSNADYNGVLKAYIGYFSEKICPSIKLGSD